MIWLGWVGLGLWQINYCRLLNIESCLYMSLKYLICFGWVGFYGISTIVGYLMPDLVYTCLLNKWFGLVGSGLWQINYCRLLNIESCLYMSLKYVIWFGWVGFYGISTIVGYLMPDLVHTLSIKYMIWLGLILWHINHCRLFNAKYRSYMSIRYIWFVNTFSW